MNRMTMVEETLLALTKDSPKGVTAEEVATVIKSDRSNVSRDLNTLTRMGKCVKKKSRPVLFFPAEINEELTIPPSIMPLKNSLNASQETFLDHFSNLNPSLKKQIELGKSAVLYPSHLMHVLLLGETGVGKSMFAELLHEYGVETGKFKKTAPFIRFNCADYANNPQLLMSQLFGSVKGAYTGAEIERKGLLKQADQGILFLDEIHRLPVEGQEMLFTYMDTGTFKPLGETVKSYQVNVMLVGATTEESSALLPTFSRRIPIEIELPALANRTMEERLQLFNHFTQSEVDKLGMGVKFSTNSIKCFLGYKCDNNIGQLKLDIRIVFAKAYAQYLTGKMSQIVIATDDLPNYVKEGLLSGVAHRKMWALFENFSERFYDFYPKEAGKKHQSKVNTSIYEEINLMFNQLESKHLDIDDIQKEMESDLEEYISKHHQEHQHFSDSDALISFIPESILRAIEQMIQYCEELLQEKLSQKVHQALAIHLYNTVERLSSFQALDYKDAYRYTKDFPELHEIAKKAIVFLEKALQLSIPIEEANYLLLFFTYDNLNKQQQNDTVKVIVIAHGELTATALSDTANRLLRTKSVVGINAHLDEKPQSVYNDLKTYIELNHIDQDVLLLVDMGSLMTFSQNLMKDFNINAKAIPLVSTMHVLEAARKSMLGLSLDEVFSETLRVNDYLENILKLYNVDEIVAEASPASLEQFVHKRKPLAVLSICLTGEGTAVTIKELLEQKLKLKEKNIKIIPLNFIGKESVQSRIMDVEEKYRIICIVSTFHIETLIPNFDLFNVMNETGISKITTLIQEELAYGSMSETIKSYYDLNHIDEIISQIYNFNEKMELLLTTRFNSSELIGLSFHIVGMILKDQQQEVILEFTDSNSVLEENIKFVNRIQEEFSRVFQVYFNKLDKNQLNYVAYSYLSIRR